MDCSNHDIDPELRDPLLDSYHTEGAMSPEEIKARRISRKNLRNTRTFVVDISNVRR